MSSITELEILLPDDFHHHLRDGDVLRDIVSHAERSFGRILAMPNIKPPVRSLEEALEYRSRILAHVGSAERSAPLEVMMTLYLTDFTTPEEIIRSFASGVVYGAKLYPAGATTNSEFGVTDIVKAYPALQTMSDVGMPLLMHGEVTDSNVDIFDRERIFIDTILRPLIAKYPNLKVVMEHITTEDAVTFIMDENKNNANLVATITAHHLLYNRNDLFKGGVCPHMYCLPILKREKHRVALVAAATSGSPKFFLGTDSAPHTVGAKEAACGCAGIFTGHAAIELYAEAFDQANELHKLEGFASTYGQKFYNLKQNTRKIKLIKESWKVPEEYSLGSSVVKPLRAGENILWRFEEV